jgi:excisionase family DNA binding protein
MPEPKLLTVEEAAKILRVDPKTVYRLISDNELKAALIGRVYRIDVKDLDDFIHKSKIKVQKAPKKHY